MTINIEFRRIWVNQFLCVYLPSGICVLVTCLTFWFGLDTTTERLTVSSYNLLALITLFVITNESLPPNQTLTGMEWWILFCILHVLLQVLEQILVDDLYLRGCIRQAMARRHQLIRQLRERQKIEQQNALNQLIQRFYNRKHFLRDVRHLPAAGPADHLQGARPPPGPVNALPTRAAEQLIQFQRRLAFNCFVCRTAHCEQSFHWTFRVLLRAWRCLEIRSFGPGDPEYWPLMVDRISRFFFLFSLVLFFALYYPITLYLV